MSEELLKQILEELKSANADKRLWDITQVAEYFNMKRSTVSNKIIAAPDFPKCITVDRTHPRWKPEEVKKWADRHRA
jgi:predicted DNA-binding transcriptional regulator AlpA